MADEPKTTRLLVIASINPSTPDRLIKMVPAFLATLQRVAVGPVESAFRSLHADHFGYFIRTRLKPHLLNDLLRTPSTGHVWVGDDGWVEPFLTNSDHLMILEIGDQFSGSTDFSRAFTWLQRH